MLQCSLCGRPLTRVHRTFAERLLYSQVVGCKCGYRSGKLHDHLAVLVPRRTLRFVLSSTTCCIKCGRDDIERMVKRDRVDSMSRHLFSRIVRFTLAPLNRCPACRLQYYDWRPVKPAATSARFSGIADTTGMPTQASEPRIRLG